VATQWATTSLIPAILRSVRPIYGVLFAASHAAAGLNPVAQVLVPFYDEPVFSVRELNSLGNTLSTVTAAVRLVGFVRNVQAGARGRRLGNQRAVRSSVAGRMDRPGPRVG